MYTHTHMQKKLCQLFSSMMVKHDESDFSCEMRSNFAKGIATTQKIFPTCFAYEVLHAR